MTVTVVDAFADRPFAGNPAAVVVLDAPAPAAWMRDLAVEMNLSETAFLTPGADGAYGLRWLTPEVEVNLCGHATLASAHVLFESGRLVPDAEARFDTRSGRLTVRAVGEGRYVMDFPATPPEAGPLAGIADALGATPVWTGRTRFDAFVVLDSEAAVRDLAPDIDAMLELGVRGVIVTAQADEGAEYAVVSRFFAPGSGIAEDPVTGSAHCALGPYWADLLGTDTLACVQVSSRGGAVGVRVEGDRVELTGQALTVYRAELAPAAEPHA
ncbi:PhzF family phenazine biosynthesis protein [Rubrivirga sp. IMCC43871]|uniref:PhzF family phenazine biosynthesis protein n=1 Tax=Rubrivirga sp. IMCC43871 TaxID=3391575 RepID=UPI00398FCF87